MLQVNSIPLQLGRVCWRYAGGPGLHRGAAVGEGGIGEHALAAAGLGGLLGRLFADGLGRSASLLRLSRKPVAMTVILTSSPKTLVEDGSEDDVGVFVGRRTG